MVNPGNGSTEVASILVMDADNRQGLWLPVRRDTVTRALRSTALSRIL